MVCETVIKRMRRTDWRFRPNTSSKYVQADVVGDQSMITASSSRSQQLRNVYKR